MLTCDSVNVDPASGKHFIFGHFSSIKVKAFPAVQPTLTLFVGMNDLAAGEHNLELKFGNPSATPPPPPKKKFPWDPAPPAFDPMQSLLKQKLNSTGPEQRVYFISELKELTFDVASNYKLLLLVDGQPLGDVSLSVAS